MLNVTQPLQMKRGGRENKMNKKLEIKEIEFLLYLRKNLIWCEDTSSFTHRLMDKLGKRQQFSHDIAQYHAIEALNELYEEFVNEAKTKK